MPESMLSFSKALQITLYSPEEERTKYFGEDSLHLNEEFCRGLANYLLNLLPKGYETFLEVGAGTGNLSRALNERGVPIIATDRKPLKGSTAEKITYAQALRKYNPHLVVCSWMPMQVDWTQAFRETESVREYILIGPPYLCGKSKTYRKRGRWAKQYLKNVQRYATGFSDTPAEKQTKVISFRRIA